MSFRLRVPDRQASRAGAGAPQHTRCPVLVPLPLTGDWQRLVHWSLRAVAVVDPDHFVLSLPAEKGACPALPPLRRPFVRTGPRFPCHLVVPG